MLKEQDKNITRNNRIQNRMLFLLLAPTWLLALDDMSPWFNGWTFRYNQCLNINIIILYPLQLLELECTLWTTHWTQSMQCIPSAAWHRQRRVIFFSDVHAMCKRQQQQSDASFEIFYHCYITVSFETPSPL